MARVLLRRVSEDARLLNPPASSWTLYGQPFLTILALGTLLQSLSLGWRDGFPDFAIFYESAVDLRTGLDPYALERGVNSHPPGVIALFQFLTVVGPRVAGVLFTVLSLACGVLAARLIARALGQPESLVLLLLASVQPAALAIRQGQVSLILMLLMTVAWRADRQGRSWLAGVLVGLVAFDKPFYALFGLYWVWRRDWKAVAGALLAGLAVIGVSVLTLGVELHARYLETLGLVNWHAELVNGSIQGLTSRLFLSRPFPFVVETSPLLIAPGLAVALTVALAGVVIVLSLRGLRTVDQAWATVSTAALLLSPLGWAYYLPVCAGPLLSVLRTAPRRAVAGLWVMLAVPFAVLAAGAPYGPLGTLAIGCWYAWATWGLFAALIDAARRTDHTAGGAAASHRSIRREVTA